MKYRSMSCEDARQAVNESLLNVSSMQHLLDSRRSVSVARLNWAANKPRNDKLDLDEDEAKERRTGDTFNPKKDPSIIISTTPKGKKRVAVIPNKISSTSPSSTTRGSPNS